MKVELNEATEIFLFAATRRSPSKSCDVSRTKNYLMIQTALCSRWKYKLAINRKTVSVTFKRETATMDTSYDILVYNFQNKRTLNGPLSHLAVLSFPRSAIFVKELFIITKSRQ